LVNSKQTPPIPLPNLILETTTECHNTPKQKIKNKSKVEQMKFNWVNGNKMDFEVDISNNDYVSLKDYLLTPFEYFDKIF